MTDDELLAMRRMRLMKDLVQSPAWLELEAIHRAQIESRKEVILAPAASDDFLKMEYLKGAMYGIQLAIETPHSIIRDGEAILAEQDAQSDTDQLEMFE